MSGISSLAVLICCAGVGTGMMSLLIPQKRTKRILGFVLGLFILVTLINGVKASLSDLSLAAVDTQVQDIAYSDGEYTDAVVRQTADELVRALDELLRDEGIEADDIGVELKISSDGRITADRIDIYISEQYRGRKNDVSSIVNSHLSKEPHIYVQGQEAE